MADHGPARALRLGDEHGLELVHGPPGDAQEERAHQDRQHPPEPELEHRLVGPGRVEHRHRQHLGGDGHAMGDDVVAPRAPQPQRVPGVDDLEVGRRHVGEPPVRPGAVGPGRRGVAVHHHDADLGPLAVETAAGEPPPAVDPVAAVPVGHRSTHRAEDRRGGDRRRVDQGLGGHVGLQPSEEERRVADEATPARGPVGVGQPLEDVDDFGEGALEPAEPGGEGQAEEAVAFGRRHDLGGQGPLLLAVGGFGSGQIDEGVERVGGAGGRSQGGHRARSQHWLG